MTTVVIVGGGPGGYEAALVAHQLGADVTVVDRDGLGGSAVLTDCVPSKALIATANVITAAASRPVSASASTAPRSSLIGVDLGEITSASGSCRGAERHLTARPRGHPVSGRGRSTRRARSSSHTAALIGPRRRGAAGHRRAAQGAPGRPPDGDRILTWSRSTTPRCPMPHRRRLRGHGAEFAGAYHGLAARSSSSPRATTSCPRSRRRTRRREVCRGLRCSPSRAVAARRAGDGVR